MTREEAIRILDPKTAVEATREMDYDETLSVIDEAGKIAVAALRGPAREQVAALKGKWKKINHWEYGELSFDTLECSKCEYEGEFDPEDNRPRFCPNCGRPMTDEAVDIVMKRLEELHETE